MGEDIKTIIHVYQYLIFLLSDNKSISGRHMKVVVNIRLCGYMGVIPCSYFIDKNHSSIIMLVFNAIRFNTDICVYFGY